MKCSACKQEKEIVTGFGALPLCEDCVPLITNYFDAKEEKDRFFRELQGFVAETFDTGNDDANYELEQISQIVQRIKHQLISVDVLLTNLSNSIMTQSSQNKGRDD